MVLLADLIDFSRDGEWGNAAHTDGFTRMRVVRATDFEAFRHCDLSGIPIRYVQDHKALMKRLRVNDILIETAGGTADRPTGRTVFVGQAQADASDLPLTCASFARFVRIDCAKADPRYVYLWLDNAWKQRDLLRYNVQHTGVARFHWTKCAESLVISLPDRATQARIAEPMLAIDALIANIRRRVEVLEVMARTIYREWFVHFRYPGHENATLIDSPLGPIPEDWRADRLGQVATVNRASRTPAKDETIEYLDISVLGDGAVGQLSAMSGADAPGRARRVVTAGDVVWSMVRPNRRAHALLVNPEPSWIASTGLAVLTPSAVTSALLYESVSTREFTEYLTSQEGGAAYPAVKPKDFEAAIMLVPTSELDRRFDEVVGSKHKMIWSLRAQSAQLASLRDLLLPKLVTGQIDVSSLDLDALLEEAGA